MHNGFRLEQAEMVEDAAALRDRIDERYLGFTEASEMSGIDPRQFRNGLDRGTLNIGEKLRVGRWAFSPRDVVALTVIDVLTRSTWMALGKAAEVATIVSKAASLILSSYGDHLAAEIDFVILESNERLQVLKFNSTSNAYFSIDGEEQPKPIALAYVTICSKRICTQILVYSATFTRDVQAVGAAAVFALDVGTAGITGGDGNE